MGGGDSRRGDRTDDRDSGRHHDRSMSRSSVRRRREDDGDGDGNGSDDASRKKHKRHHKHKERRHRHASEDEKDNGGRAEPRTHIHDEDFFLRATEFRVWLKLRRNKYIDELSTEEATRLFQDKFVKRWNAGRLDRMYYDGIPERVLETTRRTRHAWGFVTRLNDKERLDLASAKDSVGVATRKSDLLATKAHEPLSGASGTLTGELGGKHCDPPENDVDDYTRRQQRRADDRRHRRQRNSDLEELVPRETGREAMLERRRERSDRLHGAARDRDAQRDGLDFDDDFLMGGNGGGVGTRGPSDDIQRRLAQRADARGRRDQALQERAAAAAARETARMDKFLQDMGIAPNNGDGRPITIRPRNAGA